MDSSRLSFQGMKLRNTVGRRRNLLPTHLPIEISLLNLFEPKGWPCKAWHGSANRRDPDPPDRRHGIRLRFRVADQGSPCEPPVFPAWRKARERPKPRLRLMAI